MTGILEKNKTIFEYGSFIDISNRELLESYLNGIWKNYKELLMEGYETEEEISSNQPFLQFDGNTAKAKNYIGFIQLNDTRIEVYPKIFTKTRQDKALFLKHIFYWFDHCNRWKVPFNKAGLDLKDISDFPELIIYLMASKILETISTTPYYTYIEIEERRNTVVGRIDFNNYLKNGLATGNYHKIDCVYDSFIFDNKINRIIKYCTRLLQKTAEFQETKAILEQILFILDEVNDRSFNSADLTTVTFNQFFEEYKDIMDFCEVIIKQQIYSNDLSDITQWCLMFPMEYIFEDFVAGFLEKHFSDKFTIDFQKSEMYLVEQPEKIFKMRHDIFVTNDKGKSIIMDTKYKPREADFKEDKKRGVSQSDLYQMVSYAVRRGLTDIVILYPNNSEALNEPDTFVVSSGFSGGEKIRITAVDIPFWSVDNFESLEEKLKKRLEQLLDFKNATSII